MRRVAVIALVGGLTIGVLTPLTARSAPPGNTDTLRLLAQVESGSVTGAIGLDRGGSIGRERSASLALAAVGPALGPEDLAPSELPDGPSTLELEATIYNLAVPRSVKPPPINGDEITGRATWYCCTLGYRGQAVVALPGALGGHYDPAPASRYVTVCGDRCVRLPVVDYCGCYWGTASQRIADLSPEAWAAVSDAPLSRGVITVTVHLDG